MLARGTNVKISEGKYLGKMAKVMTTIASGAGKMYVLDIDTSVYFLKSQFEIL